MNENNYTKKTYTKFAKTYSDLVKDKDYNAYYERPVIKKLITESFPKLKDVIVLDAGCGPGLLSEWLVNNGCVVSATDFIAEMVDIARERMGNKGKTFRADLNKPLDMINDNEFDLIVSSLVLHYIKDWYTLMKEFYRILKHGGILIYSVHHPIDHYQKEKSSYFDTILNTETWKGFGNDFTVSFYSRPLKDHINSITKAKLIIDEFNEDIPKEFQEKFPKDYQKLKKQPAFLFVKAHKNK